MERARGLAGYRLADLAERVGWRVPADQRRAKGFVGQLLEENLGATAANRPRPDFERLGIELKTIPIGDSGAPAETTYVTHVSLADNLELTWATSACRHKLERVLWMPVQASRSVPLEERRVGAPLIWSPSAEEERTLQADWEELMSRIRMGEVEQITAREGQWLQIRPKGADSHARTWGIDENGHRFKTLPRGWYLRTLFTRGLLARNFI